MAKQPSNDKPVWSPDKGWRYPLKTRQNRRMTHHDYSVTGTYLVTISVKGRMPVFGTVEGRLGAALGSADYPHLTPSSLGVQVKEQEVAHISRLFPMVEVWALCLMPDHLHMIVHVSSPLPEGKHLGHVVRGFKTGCTRAWWRLAYGYDWQTGRTLPAGEAAGTVARGCIGGVEGGAAEGGATANGGTGAAAISERGAAAANGGTGAAAISESGAAAANGGTGAAAINESGAATGNGGTGAAGISGTGAAAAAMTASSAAAVSGGLPPDRRLPLLFEEGYNDHILMNDGQLESWKAYLRDNPWRLLARRLHPEYMQRCLCVVIGGVRFAAFGNFMLLRHPEKVQVFCHRMARMGQLSDEERQRYGYGAGRYVDNFVTKVPYETTAAYREESWQWTVAAATGHMVIVTPGISKGELMMKNTCVEEHMPLIHLQKEPIGELWKPEKSRFEACLAGTLLILAPLEQAGESDYERFHDLNALAAMICRLGPGDDLRLRI